MEVLGKLQITKNSLGSYEMLLARLGDVLGECSDDVGKVWSCEDHGVNQRSIQTLVKSSVIISQSISR